MTVYAWLCEILAGHRWADAACRAHRRWQRTRWTWRRGWVRARQRRHYAQLLAERPMLYLPRCEGTRIGQPSRSEVRRMIQKGSILMNGTRVTMQTERPAVITQFVFFAGAPMQTTLY